MQDVDEPQIFYHMYKHVLVGVNVYARSQDKSSGLLRAGIGRLHDRHLCRWCLHQILSREPDTFSASEHTATKMGRDIWNPLRDNLASSYCV